MLQGILPQQGNLLTVRTVRELRQKLEFAEREITDWNMHPGDPTKHVSDDLNLPKEQEGLIYWNDVDTEVDTKFTAKQREEVVKALTELSEKGELEEGHLSLCDKFELE